MIRLQRLAGNSAVTQLLESDARHVERSVHSVLSSPGAQLDPSIRRTMEDAFNTDFTSVRLHTGPAAAASARDLGADAYTAGESIVVGRRLDPSAAADRRILAHELTHVVQQRSGPVAGNRIGSRLSVSDPSDRFEREAEATAGRVVSRSHTHAGSDHTCSGRHPGGSTTKRTGPVQRHSSHEHFILGNLSPGQVEQLSKGVEVFEKRGAWGTDGKETKKIAGLLKKGSLNQQEQADVNDAVHLIDAQVQILERWRRSEGPDPAKIKLGDKTPDAAWGGQLVVIECAGGAKLAATIGDMNAIPDFVGSIDDLRAMSKSTVHGILQSIRRTTWVQLKEMKATLEGKKSTVREDEMKRVKEGKGTWKGAESVKTDLHGSSGLESLANIGSTNEMTKGKATGGSAGAASGLSYKPTLARNACHFPPESWLRWRDYHERAKAVINSATDSEDLKAKANEAYAVAAFGEHYLQDSYAGGHLINKGYIMAIGMERTYAATQKNRGIGPEQIQEFKRATAHEEAYDAPALSKQLMDLDNAPRSIFAAEKQERVRNRRDATQKLGGMKAQDPQSALDKARSSGGRVSEVEAAGLDPTKVSLKQYRTWVNDAYYQKLTNTLHDVFCKKGISVSAPVQRNLFTIFGDSNMLRSAEGSKFAAETSAMSQRAVQQLIEHRRWKLGGGIGMEPKLVQSYEIMARFPDQVNVDGQDYTLKEWATGKAAEDLVTKECQAWTNGTSWLNKAIRNYSSVTGFSKSLGKEHVPF